MTVIQLRFRHKKDNKNFIDYKLDAINYMSTNHRGDSFSKIITQRRSKELNNKQISTSFQQLYDLLSRKGNKLDKSHQEYRSTPKSNPSGELKSKVNISLAYQNHVEQRIAPHQINKVSKLLGSDPLSFKLEAFYKQRGSLTPNEKKTSIQSTNQKLKNIILGKKSRKQEFIQEKSGMEQITTPILKHEKLMPLNIQNFSSKKNIVPKSQQSIKKLDRIKTQQKEYLSYQSNKKVKTEAEEVYCAQAISKYKKGSFNKRLMINGSHLVHLLKHSSKTSEVKSIQNDKRKESPAKKNFFKQINRQKAFILPQQSNGNSRNNSPSQKTKKGQKQIAFGKFLEKLPISQHIIWKIQKMFTFNLFFLRSFGFEIFYSDPRYLSKYHKSNHFYGYYVGGGNNRSLILQALRKRWWWKQVTSIESAHFVWTQQKNVKLINLLKSQQKLQKQPKNARSNSIMNVQKFKQNSKSNSERSGDKLLKRLLTHSYKIRKPLKSEPLVIKTMETPQVLHNHIANNHILGDKKNLFFLLKQWITIFKSQPIEELFSIIPQTFHLQNTRSSQYLQFQQSFKTSSCLWIVKPGQNSNRGRGIFLSSQLLQIRESIQNRLQQGGSTIIQKYKTDLLLYKGRKFDIRTYMLCIIIRGARKYFWYSQGYARTSSHLFSVKELNPMIHLTNDAIQSKGEMYGRFQKGNKLSYNQLQAYVSQSFPNKEWKIESLTSKMKEISKEVARASYPLIDQSKKEGFQLFGLDFIVDSDFKPCLLQVNTNPCLQVSAPVLQNIIPNVIENLFRLVVDPLFPPNMLPDKQHQYNFSSKAIQTNRFELVFDSLSERDQSWQSFCEKSLNFQFQSGL